MKKKIPLTETDEYKKQMLEVIGKKIEESIKKANPNAIRVVDLDDLNENKRHSITPYFLAAFVLSFSIDEYVKSLTTSILKPIGKFYFDLFNLQTASMGEGLPTILTYPIFLHFNYYKKEN